MAVEVTPLGFKKPDGNERVRDGDNVISDNAQKSQDLISAARTDINAAQTDINGHAIRIASIESAVGVGGGLLMEDPSDPGFYIVGGP